MSYSSAADWMGQAWNWIGERPLARVCLPGSHDSGIAVLTHQTSFSTQANTRTQKLSIADQLLAGCRFFDIRPTLWNGTWYTAHGSRVRGLWFGGAGESLATIVDSATNFVNAHPRELVILRFSHVECENWADAPTIDQFAQVLKGMLSYDLMVRFNDPDVKLGTKTISELHNAGRILCIFDGLVKPDPSSGLFRCTWADPLVDMPPAVAALGDNNLVALCAATNDLYGASVFSERFGGDGSFANLQSCPNFQAYHVVRTVNPPGTPLAFTWNPPTLMPRVCVAPGIMPAVASSGNMVVAVYVSCDFRDFRKQVGNDPGSSNIPPGDGQLAVICSLDGGFSWGEPAILEGGRTKLAPAVAGDENGNFYVMFVSSDTSVSSLRIITVTFAGSTNPVEQSTHTLSETSDHSPALFWDKKQQCLIAMYAKQGGTNIVQMSLFSNNITSWTSTAFATYQQTMSMNSVQGAAMPDPYLRTASSLSIACDANNNKMMIYVPPGTNGVSYATYQDASWKGWSRGNPAEDALLKYPATLACVGGTFIAFYMLPNGVMGYSLCDGPPGDPEDYSLWKPMVPRGCYRLFDEYSNSSVYSYVINDQLEKFGKFSGADYGMFLLSWTCTQAPGISSIEALAGTINPHLDQAMSGLLDTREISPDTKVPNVLNVDFFDEFVTQVAWKINTR